MRMEIYDFGFNRLGFIEKYDSVQYTEKFQDVGTFQLTCPKTDKNVKLLREDNVIWFEAEVAGIIQYVDIKRDSDSTIEIKGNLIGQILDWRWIYPCFVKTANPATLMEQLVYAHCVSPSDDSRKMNGLVVGTKDIVLKPSVTYQKTGGSVLDSEKKLAEANGLGFAIYFNPRNVNKLKFVVLHGKDRTANNKDGNVPVIFSRSLNNLISGDYVLNGGDYRNTGLVAGEAIDGSNNENANRRTLEVFRDSKKVSGYDRKELFIDARDLQSEYSDTVVDAQDADDTSKKMTDEEYNATLLQRGNEKLDETNKEESYTGEVRTDSKTKFIYREDYELGDIVTLSDEDIGLRMDVAIMEMSITYDKTGYSYTPTFGKAVPTLYQKIERR